MVLNKFVAFATYSPISLKGPTTPELSFSDVCEIVANGLQASGVLVPLCSGTEHALAWPVPYSIFWRPSAMKAISFSFSAALGAT
jgi:hypothetical protein